MKSTYQEAGRPCSSTLGQAITSMLQRFLTRTCHCTKEIPFPFALGRKDLSKPSRSKVVHNTELKQQTGTQAGGLLAAPCLKQRKPRTSWVCTLYNYRLDSDADKPSRKKTSPNNTPDLRPLLRDDSWESSLKSPINGARVRL